MPSNHFILFFKPFFFGVAMLCCGSSYGQNLIQNPSFEIHENCPEKLSTFSQDVTFWNIPTLGTTDYFNVCSKEMTIPKNFKGEQEVRFGDAYAGFYMYAPKNYREYLQVPLVEELQAGELYVLSFYVSLAEKSKHAVSAFGILFSETPLQIATKKEITTSYLETLEDIRFHFISVEKDEVIAETKKWVRMERTFTAKGGERFLIVGNFEENRATRNLQLKKYGPDHGYYYIDNFELLKKEKAPYQLETTYIFKHVLFDFDAFVITEKGEQEIKAVLKYMLDHPQYQLHLMGHTDGFGSNAYNKVLSENRVNAVARAFEAYGLPRGQITTASYGSGVPVATNTTDNGRAKNRRVEFRITEN